MTTILVCVERIIYKGLWPLTSSILIIVIINSRRNLTNKWREQFE
jgi:hypothetical protein